MSPSMPQYQASQPKAQLDFASVDANTTNVPSNSFWVSTFYQVVTVIAIPSHRRYSC